MGTNAALKANLLHWSAFTRFFLSTYQIRQAVYYTGLFVRGFLKQAKHGDRLSQVGWENTTRVCRQQVQNPNKN